MCSLQSNCKQKRIQLFYKTCNWFLCFLFQFGFPDSSMFKKFQLLSFPYFLDNELSQLSLVSYGSYYLYLSFSFFLCCQAVCFVLALLQAQQNWVCSTVDRFIKNEGSSCYVGYRQFCVSRLSWNGLVELSSCCFLFNLRKPIGSR